MMFLPVCVLAGELPTLELKYKEGENIDYSDQIKVEFTKLLSKDHALAADFSVFEDAPPPSVGRYSGDPIIQSMVIAESEDVDFRDSGGTKVFAKTIALYYRYDQGHHRGRNTSSGFFAVFVVSGKLTYRSEKNEEDELTKAVVVAKFRGFSRTLSAPKPSDLEEQNEAEQDGADQPATRSESKSESDEKPKPESEGRPR